MPVTSDTDSARSDIDNELSLKLCRNGPFYPGDPVKGKLITQLPYVCARGELVVRLSGILDSQLKGSLNMDVSEFHTQEIRLWFNPDGDNDNGDSGTRNQQQGYPMRGSLPAGRHTYPFSFTLPDGIYALPSSFNAPQNQLRYTVRAELRGTPRPASTESVIGQLCSQLLTSSSIARRVERQICVRNHVDADQPGLCRPVNQVAHLSRAGWLSRLTRAASSMGRGRRANKPSASMGAAVPLRDQLTGAREASADHTPRLRLSMSRTGYCPGEWIYMNFRVDHNNDHESMLAPPPPPSLMSSSSSSSTTDGESVDEPAQPRGARVGPMLADMVAEQLQQQSQPPPPLSTHHATLGEQSMPDVQLLQVPLASAADGERISLASSGMTRTYVPTPYDKLSVDILLRREITCVTKTARDTERTAVAVGTHEFGDVNGGAIELRLPAAIIPTTDDPAVGISIQYYLKITARFTTRKPSGYSAGRLLNANTQSRVCILRVPITIGTCRSSQYFETPPRYEDACSMPPAYESQLPFTHVISAARPRSPATTDDTASSRCCSSSSSADDDDDNGDDESIDVPAIAVDEASTAASRDHYQLDLPRFSVSSFAETITQLSHLSTSQADSAFAMDASLESTTTTTTTTTTAADPPLLMPRPIITHGWWNQYPSGTHSTPASPICASPSSASTHSAAAIAAAMARHERAYASAPCSPLVAQFARQKSPMAGGPGFDFPLPILEVEGRPEATSSPATINGWV
ncbi:hypothetical protein SYNPS1DRAFT_27602 [Syncephalis pseudoplumigaleata]|uniref:Arrestin-like N-terminal domain-containing protein n=1 Tax=Syncephalis pseudoplumigaleata TaxID=1712513 RepID=A0A4P9Z548_9FUNG|nr:hypothetical protein SYNPS1DRAFT_27602 [Syncephalis pseudoplumigaleata]|eukprot:RKP26720.1 hypothetical protein SYNPS1DRAFT_27602 [Syncephalis pseudoplumigaleata]